MAEAQRNGGSREMLAITGFCWGGRIVWLYAAHNPKLKAGVAWYGRLAPPANDGPLDLIPFEWDDLPRYNAFARWSLKRVFGSSRDLSCVYLTKEGLAQAYDGKIRRFAERD